MIAPIIEGEDVSIVSKNGDVNIVDTKNKLLSYNYSYEEKTDLTSIVVSGVAGIVGSVGLVSLGMVPVGLGVLRVTVSGVTGAFISLLENNQIAKEIIRKNHDEIIIKANINAKNLKIIAANKLLLPYQDAIIADNKDIRAFAGIKRYRLELVHELKEEINKSGTDYGLAIITGLISSGLVTCFIRSAFVPTITLSDSNGNNNTQPQLPFEFDSQDKNKSIEDDEDTLTVSKNTINNNQITFLQNNPLLASNTNMPLPRVTDIETINQVRQLFEAAGIALLAGDTILVPAIAAVGGTYMLYRGGRFVANVVRKRKEVKQQQRAIGYSNQTTTASPNPLPPRRDDEDKESREEKKKSNILEAKSVGSAEKQDPYHKVADSKLIKQEILNSDNTKIFDITGRDGNHYTLIQGEGTVNGKVGIFEYIVNDANEITHQVFVEGGKVTGTPNIFGK